MDTESPADRIIGYCTNVHAGATLEQTKANLEEYALAVKRIVSPDEPMGIGLWLSRQCVNELFSQGAEGLPQLGPWLDDHGLIPFTFNGFPYGDFHQPVVKHRVYEPDWSTTDRLGYTHALAAVLTEISPEFSHRSISTLPLGWPKGTSWQVDSEATVANLLGLTKELRRIADTTGVFIHVDLEPEPGCLLQRSSDVVTFFQDHLIPAGDRHDLPAEVVCAHIRVCHDICHTAVMFENQAEAIACYENAGIRIGKVQVSSAIRIPFDAMSDPERTDTLRQVQAFAEDRYLHQTMIRLPDGDMDFFEDLPLAIASIEDDHPVGEWRIHFHMPIFLDRFGLIETTQDQIRECLRAIKPQDDINHFEVETYAWNVLPKELRTDDLAEGIAREILWLNDRFADEDAR